MGKTQAPTNIGIAPTIRSGITKGGDRFWRPEHFDDLGNPNAVDQAGSGRP